MRLLRTIIADNANVYRCAKTLKWPEYRDTYEFLPGSKVRSHRQSLRATPNGKTHRACVLCSVRLYGTFPKFYRIFGSRAPCGAKTAKQISFFCICKGEIIFFLSRYCEFVCTTTTSVVRMRIIVIGRVWFGLVRFSYRTYTYVGNIIYLKMYGLVLVEKIIKFMDAHLPNYGFKLCVCNNFFFV